MIYKYTKCESVIAKIMADSDMATSKMRITDIKEWIFEAVEKIGAPMQYIERESGVDGCPIFKIEDYQIPIPEELHRLTAVAYSATEHGPWKPVRVDNSEFKGFDKHRHFQHPHHRPEQPMRYKPITSQSQLYDYNGMKLLNRMLDDNHFEEPTFFIKPGWIVLNKPKGFVKLQYSAVATDEHGYPLIPDLASYQEAIYWYVMMKLTFPKWLNGNFATKRAANGAQYAYTYIQQQWNFYRNQAYADAMMPTESDMRGIKNEWNKFVPEWDSDEVFFKAEGAKQLNYKDYYYGY